jgi:hypothetical protein
MPNTRAVGAVLKRADGAIVRSKALSEIWGDAQTARRDLQSGKNDLSEIPDTDKASSILDDCQQTVDKYAKMLDFAEDIAEELEGMETDEVQLDAIPDIGEVQMVLQECSVVVDKHGMVSTLASELVAELDELESIEAELKSCNVKLKRAKEECTDALKDVDLCPLTQKPISNDCMATALEGVK